MPSTSSFASSALRALAALSTADSAKSANFDVQKTLRVFANSVAKAQFRVGGLEVVAALAAVLLVLAFALSLRRKDRPVYLVDFNVFRAPDRMKMSREAFMDRSRKAGAFDDKALTFQDKMVMKGGLGDHTYLPDAMHASPPVPSMALAREEAEIVMFSAVRDALAAADLRPKDVDCVVVNCSLFNPTPSLAAMLVNHFKMRPDVVSYSLSGMGCSAGVISIALARELLQTYKNSTCLVVSTENITQNWYFGNERSMLIPNCLFRVGGAAIVLSNKPSDARRAKYKLDHVVRTHMGGSDASYRCVYQHEDPNGKVGVHLSKDLMAIAGHALKANITALGPRVLPLGEKLKFVANLVGRKVLRIKGLAPYTPDFTTAFDHFCIHTGGRGVIDEMEKQLRLPSAAVAPSRDTLRRYGNTSSSSIWYILARIESRGKGVRRGERVWQIAFGSGFKCNSAVWTALRKNRVDHVAWEPVDEEEILD